MDARDLLLVLGAGASFGGEAGLPLFWQIRKRIVDVLVPRMDLDPRDSLFESFVERMAPESFFHAFASAGVDVVRALVDTFNASVPQPNAVHHACASLLKDGAKTWTTNYDTLLEEACDDLGRRAAVWTPPAPQPPHYDIAKPHGSLRARVKGVWSADPSLSLVFETTHLLADLPAEWADALVHNATGRGIVLVGYSGADVDMAPHLKQAIDAADWALWFATSSEERRLIRRYDLSRRPGPPGDPPLVLSANPADSFLQWLKQNRLISRVDACPPNLSPDLRGFGQLVFPELLRADILANLGLAQTSQALYKGMRWSRGVPMADRLTASLRLARRNASRLRRRRVPAALMRGLTRLPRRAPGVAVARRLAAEDARTADAWPGTDVLRRWYENADPRTYRGIGLNLIRRLRYEGRLKEAQTLAEHLLRDARFANPSPNHVAGFSFQLTEIFRMQGRMTAALELIERGFSRILGTSLVLWEEFEELACCIQRFDDSPDIDDRLVTLARSFSRIDEPFGQETISLAYAIHRRQMGDYSGSLLTLMLLAESTRSTSPLLHNEALFHCAETLRLLGQTDAALQRLDAIDRRWYLHDPFAKVVRAIIGPPNLDLRASLQSAHVEFVTKGCPWGQAIAADVADYLSVDIGLSATEVSEARAWFATERTRAYSSDPGRWTFAMV
ncbi:MAG: SIR2 family protein [Actinomycetota bacterium]|nr:SIR2 family protein [Actinomycetota bacterium]